MRAERDGRREEARRLSRESSRICRDLELTSRGTAAWTRQRFEGSTNVIEIRKLNAAGESIVDAGPDIDPRSLAVSGSILYWTRGGTPRSVELD